MAYSLDRTQRKNMGLINSYARRYGANSREVKQLQSLAWAETRFRNIGEGGTAGASKRKTGSVGRGIFQYTDPGLRKQDGVTNSWSILQSTRGALRSLRRNRAYWAKRGIKTGSRDMTDHLMASWNAGTGRAHVAITDFKTTRKHVFRAGGFMSYLQGGNVPGGANPANQGGAYSTGNINGSYANGGFGGNRLQQAQNFFTNMQGATLPDTGFLMGVPQANDDGMNAYNYQQSELPYLQTASNQGVQQDQLSAGVGGVNVNVQPVDQAQRLQVSSAIRPDILYQGSS